MDPIHIFLLLGAGLAAGFVAGLIGVGGGIIFAPVLFFSFQRIGIAPDVIAPLTLGSSLLCTFVASSASAWFQYRQRAILPRVALHVGLFSAVAIFLMTRFVTTQTWYDGTVFQIVFSAVLLIVVSRMILKKNPGENVETDMKKAAFIHPSWPTLAGTGSVAGAVASASGVGGGVVLVPAYNSILRIPIHLATGTSSATIIIISLVSVVTYAILGWDADVPATALGYVDAGQALILAIPAIFTARLGVWVAHRVNTRTLRLSFAVIAAFVAIRLLMRALF